MTCIKLDRSLLPLFVSKWFCDEFFFHIPLQIHYGGVVTEGKFQGQRRQKNVPPFLERSSTSLQHPNNESKELFCMFGHLCVAWYYYISHGVFFFTGADRKGMIQGEKFLLKTVASFSWHGSHSLAFHCLSVCFQCSFSSYIHCYILFLRKKKYN